VELVVVGFARPETRRLSFEALLVEITGWDLEVFGVSVVEQVWGC
jgi:hypothetical protein